jgi:hypothetical protein
MQTHLVAPGKESPLRAVLQTFLDYPGDALVP